MSRVLVVGNGLELPHARIFQEAGHDVVYWIPAILINPFPDSKLYLNGQGVVETYPFWVDIEPDLVWVGDLGLDWIKDLYPDIPVINGWQPDYEISRARALDIAEQVVSIKIPDTFILYSQEDLEKAFAFIEEKGSVVFKSDWRGDFETTVIDNVKEAKEFLKNHLFPSLFYSPIYIQEKVEGKEIGFDFYVDGEQIYIQWYGYESDYGQILKSFDSASSEIQEIGNKLISLIEAAIEQEERPKGWISINVILSKGEPYFLEFVMRPAYIASYLHTLIHTNWATQEYNPVEIPEEFCNKWIVGLSTFWRDPWGETKVSSEWKEEPFVVEKDYAWFLISYFRDENWHYHPVELIPRSGVVIAVGEDLETAFERVRDNLKSELGYCNLESLKSDTEKNFLG